MIRFLNLQIQPNIHTKNLRLLVTEIFKTLHNLNPEIMWNSFKIKPESYHLRQGISLQVPKCRSSRTINSFDFRAALAWNHLPVNIKSNNNLDNFKASIENQIIYCLL